MRLAAGTFLTLLAFLAVPSSAQELRAPEQPAALSEVSSHGPVAPQEPGLGEGIHQAIVQLGFFVRAGTLAHAGALVRAEHRAVISPIERASRMLRPGLDHRATIGLHLDF